MIALQDLPFNFVEGIGFRRLMFEVAPKYNLRGRNFFTDYVCEDLYNKVAAKVKYLIKELDFMSFTTDIWTDPSSGTSLLSLTCHGVTTEFERISIILKCETFDNRHTGDVIANKFESMLAEWNISKNQVHCMIRDGGSNMKRAMALSGINDVDCTVHKLQLAIKAGFQNDEHLQNIKEKCKKIATHFGHSTIAQKAFIDIQERLNQKKLSIFQDVPTRWNSTFYMFERFLIVKDALSIYINDHQIPTILPEEWKQMECCVNVLGPFEQATRELSSSHVLISSVKPIIYMLFKKMDEELNNDQNPENIKKFVTKIKTEISSKFQNLDSNFLYTLATYLDPRYKAKFFEPIIKDQIESELLKIATSDANINESPPKKIKKISIDSPCCSKSLQSELEMMLDSSSDDETSACATSTSDSLVTRQIKNYSQEKRLPITENPFNWWNINGHKYTTISATARKYLSAPPGSVPSEQLFSGAGLIYEPLRNRLEADKAAKLLFLKYNLPLLKFSY